MPEHQATLTVTAPRAGLHLITDKVQQLVARLKPANGSPNASLCNVFILHTSASLLVQENADPSARRDLEAYMDRLVPPLQDYFTHTAEGPDDMPSHIKAALTQTFLTIPVVGDRLHLGTWQGIYLWEHRVHPSPRKIMVTVI